MREYSRPCDRREPWCRLVRYWKSCCVSARHDHRVKPKSCQIMLVTLFNTCVRNVHAWAGQDCLLCGEESGRELLCAACIAELPALPESCPRCALPSPAAAVCGSCLNHPPHFDATLALWRYEFPCDGLVQALKYRARLALAGFFARNLASRPLPEVDLIVPMPLHPKRLAERGFNQALEVARGLARHLGRPIEPDRKSTRLNSSHRTISYAVFCLKKKKY